MKSLDFFALSFALAGTACLAGKAYDNYIYEQPAVKFVNVVKMDDSYIVAKLQRKEKTRIALQEHVRKNNMLKCKADFNCLTMAEAIYFEARGENEKGQISVGQVILTRTKRSGFPNTVYKVVHHKNSEGICHFSYVCDIESGRISGRIVNNRSYKKALEYAAGVMNGQYPNYVKNADHYYNPNKVERVPFWVAKMTQIAYIGNHRFLSSL